MPILSSSISTEIEFEVYCGTCGDGLCSNTTIGATYRRGFPYLSIEPCKKCLDTAKQDAYNEGFAEGQTE